MVAGTAGISGWCARAVLRACNRLAPSPSAGTNVTERMDEQTAVVIRSGTPGPRTPTLGTKADAARPPASRLVPGNYPISRRSHRGSRLAALSLW